MCILIALQLNDDVAAGLAAVEDPLDDEQHSDAMDADGCVVVGGVVVAKLVAGQHRGLSAAHAAHCFWLRFR